MRASLRREFFFSRCACRPAVQSGIIISRCQDAPSLALVIRDRPAPEATCMHCLARLLISNVCRNRRRSANSHLWHLLCPISAVLLPPMCRCLLLERLLQASLYRVHRGVLQGICAQCAGFGLGAQLQRRGSKANVNHIGKDQLRPCSISSTRASSTRATMASS